MQQGGVFMPVCLAVAALGFLSEVGFEVAEYDGGVVRRAEIRDPCEFVRALEKLIWETSDIVRLLVSNERVDGLKRSGALEVVFERRVTVRSRRLGDREIDRVLIPTAGDYAGVKEAPFVVLVLGVDGHYVSGPLVNQDGLLVLEKVRELLTTSES